MSENTATLAEAATAHLGVDPTLVAGVVRTTEKPGKNTKVTLKTGSEVYINLPVEGEPAVDNGVTHSAEVAADMAELADWSKADLAELAKSLHLDMPAKATKATLVEAIEDYRTSLTTSTPEEDASTASTDPVDGADGAPTE